MKINILTLFPEYFQSPLNESIIKRAQESGLVEFNIVNIRDYSTDKHHTTDDRPYGGGPGMVMLVQPIHRALRALNLPIKQSTNKTIEQFNSLTVLTSAKGDLFNQQKTNDYSKLDELTIICGHYEGVDERVAENLIDEEIRIGDYVMTGGEPAAVVISDAVSRLIPGVLGNEDSNKNESHSKPGQMAAPQYTRPEEYNGWKVPSVLLSGDHKKIEEWKKRTTIIAQ